MLAFHILWRPACYFESQKAAFVELRTRHRNGRTHPRVNAALIALRTNFGRGIRIKCLARRDVVNSVESGYVPDIWHEILHRVPQVARRIALVFGIPLLRQLRQMRAAR